MDGDSKKLRVRFSGVGKGGRGGRQTAIPPQESTPIGRAEMNSSGEYDASFAATIAAAAFAIAAREEKLATQKKSVPNEEVSPALSPVKRGESTKKPAGGNKIARWFSGKEPLEHDDDGPVNVSVRRPLKPAPGKPEEMPADHKVAPKTLETSLSVKKGSGSSSKSTDTKGSKKFEQEQAVQKAPSTVRPATSYHSRRNGEDASGVTAIGGTGSKADEWEKAKLARVREEYEKMMETIAEWETEKKVKARRQKEQKETELDRKRAKALEEYNQEMTRISKIAGGARSMAEERKYNDENKIKEKARKIQSTGKPPRTCACF
ncbi:remorin 1.4-like isoform X1 [Miscanthus floridulus]|uniref:remorin 1.4-like isoform X1 n=2 Tax=Miscanthus floridulus TaxID=154761 RepID=UPI0034594AA4